MLMARHVQRQLGTQALDVLAHLVRVSRCVSLYLPISPCISLYLPRSPLMYSRTFSMFSNGLRWSETNSKNFSSPLEMPRTTW